MSGSDFVILAPEGRLDAAGVRPFEAEWKQHLTNGETNLLIDLEGTRYISSSGLRSLLAAARGAKKGGGAVKLCCLSARLREILEMAGFDQVFDIYPDRSRAEEAFRKAPDDK